MYFRNLVLSAFVIAIFSGFCFSLYQSFFITPLILQAEVYEVAEPVNQATEIEAASPPSDGLERESWSFAANFLLCFAYALILLSLMSLHSGVNRFNAVLWGGAAFLGVFVAPALGLPPEIPGMQAAYLEGRQSWWLLTVFISLLSLWLISFKAPIHKLIGLIFISLPHLIGAPQAELHGFSHTDPWQSVH